MSFKTKARAYFTAVSNYDVEAVEKMLDENYVQHNPFVPTGRAAFLEMLPKLRAHGSKIENARMLQEGPHVAMHHRWKNAAPFGYENSVAFHIIRFDSASLIAEHWNVMAAESESRADGETRIEDHDRTLENKARVEELFSAVAQSAPTGSFFDKDLAPSPKFASIRYSKLHKVLGEGNFVLAVSEGRDSDVPSAIYDLFRLESGKIKEHWRISQSIPTENLKNENTLFGFS